MNLSFERNGNYENTDMFLIEACGDNVSAAIIYYQ